MDILPVIKKSEKKQGLFTITNNSCICTFSKLSNDNYLLSFLHNAIAKHIGISVLLSSNKAPEQNVIQLDHNGQDNSNEAYSIIVTESSIRIRGESECGLFRGITTLIQIISLYGNKIDCCEISDSPDFKIRGVLHDVTRGKVPLVDDLKEIALKCSFYKINHLQLYIEHTFAFSKIPEFKDEFDALTADEIMDFDQFCRKHHIELVPALATFGHLYELLRIKRFAHLNELDIDASALPRNLWDRMAHYTLYPKNDEGFALVQSMIGDLLPLFSSRYFNICADETFDLGKGKSQQDASLLGTGVVYSNFVNKVLDIVIGAGKIPMMWGDIICNHPEILPRFPKETIFLNWGYGADVTSATTEQFGNAGVTYMVCPGVMGWSRFANNINDASINISKMVEFGKNNRASGVLNTNWGDCCHVNFTANSIHGIALGASLSWNSDVPVNNSQFDKALSVLEWGNGCENIAGLLRELGSLTWYHLGNFYAWVNKVDCMWDKEKDLEKLTSEQLSESLQRARKIENELGACVSKSDSTERKQSLEELCCSASAIAWTLSLLILKKECSAQKCSDVNKKGTLILESRKLLERFVTLWRKRNKESELRNVITIFDQIIEKIEQF